MKTRAGKRWQAEPNRWTVGLARQNFSGVLKAAESAPQTIYRRNKLQAVILNPADAAKRHLTEGTAAPRSLWEAFEGIRQVARDTGWELPVASRADRPVDYLKAGRKRSR